MEDKLCILKQKEMELDTEVVAIANKVYHQHFETLLDVEEYLYVHHSEFRKKWQKKGNLGSPKEEDRTFQMYLKQNEEAMKNG